MKMSGIKKCFRYPKHTRAHQEGFYQVFCRYLVSWSFFPRAQSVSGHVARSPWIHLALKREISCVSSQ